MLRRTAAALALALLAGCQTITTSKSLIATGQRTQHTLRDEPHLAAVCIARNIDKHRSELAARIRPGVEPVVIEVHVSADEIVSLAQLLIQGEGSTAVIWTTPNPVYRGDELIATMIAGC